MIHCILHSPEQPLALPSGMREIRAGGLAAVVSDVDPERVRTADRPALQGYADLIGALHRGVDLIPMRYGCVADGEEAVCRLLDLRRTRLAALLDRLKGCTELGIRLLLPPLATEVAPEGPADPGSPRPGHAHLAEIRRRFQGEARVAGQAKSVKTAIEAAIAGLFRESRDELGQVEGRHLLSLYYLVPRSACGAFVEALRLAPDPLPQPLQEHCLVSGPWPPYNFVGAIDDDLRCLA